MDPGLNGTWNTGSNMFVESPTVPRTSSRDNTFGLLFVYQRNDPPRDWRDVAETVCRDLQAEWRSRGFPMVCLRDDEKGVVCCRDMELVDTSHDHPSRNPLVHFKRMGVTMVFVMFESDTSYAYIKLAAYRLQLHTSCMNFNKVMKKQREYISNVVLKAHVKLGGTNHFLASRSSSGTGTGSAQTRMMIDQDSNSRSNGNGSMSSSYQKVPDSIGWLFDEPCMLVGIDLSHPEGGVKDQQSIAAVVSIWICVFAFICLRN